MKPSIIFDRWVIQHAARIEEKSETFKRLVGFVSLELRMLELNPQGVSPGTADAIVKRLAQLKAVVEQMGWDVPDIKLPKIKIVRPKAQSRNTEQK